jgi:hypothetical protein
MTDEIQPGEFKPDDTPEFAVIEIFGHRSHAGRIFEVDRFGTKLLRIDVPKDGKFENGFTSHFYGGASVFSLTPCDLATVERINKPRAAYGRLTYDDMRRAEEAQAEEDHATYEEMGESDE